MDLIDMGVGGQMRDEGNHSQYESELVQAMWSKTLGDQVLALHE